MLPGPQLLLGFLSTLIVQVRMYWYRHCPFHLRASPSYPLLSFHCYPYHSYFNDYIVDYPIADNIHCSINSCTKFIASPCLHLKSTPEFLLGQSPGSRDRVTVWEEDGRGIKDRIQWTRQRRKNAPINNNRNEMGHSSSYHHHNQHCSAVYWMGQINNRSTEEEEKNEERSVWINRIQWWNAINGTQWREGEKVRDVKLIQWNQRVVIYIKYYGERSIHNQLIEWERREEEEEEEEMNQPYTNNNLGLLRGIRWWWRRRRRSSRRSNCCFVTTSKIFSMTREHKK